jgi:Zn-dependent protease
MVFMQQKELRDIVIAMAVLTVAFAIAFSDGIMGIFNSNYGAMLVVSFIAVALGFFLHEMGHRYLARKYGYYAEFKMWPFGLLLAMVFSLLGFVFAAPGAVLIHPKADIWGQSTSIDKKKFGIVSLIGPLANMVLAAVFFVLHLIAPISIASVEVFVLAMQINVWLALFNMIPFPPLDGQKVFAWRKDMWAVLFFALLALFVLGFVF